MFSIFVLTSASCYYIYAQPRRYTSARDAGPETAAGASPNPLPRLPRRFPGRDFGKRHRESPCIIGTSLEAVRRADLSAEQIGNRKGAAAIRHMDKINASHHLEQLTRDVLRAPDTAGAHVELARIALGMRRTRGPS